MYILGNGIWYAKAAELHIPAIAHIINLLRFIVHILWIQNMFGVAISVTGIKIISL